MFEASRAKAINQLNNFVENNLGEYSKLRNFEQVNTSCPNFLSTIYKLGGKFEKENPREYNRLYDINLGLVKQAVINLFNSDINKTRKFIKNSFFLVMSLNKFDDF